MRVDLDTGKYNVVISSSNFDVSIESGAKLDVNIGKSARIDVNSAVTYIKSGKKEIDTYVEGKVKPDILEYSKVESQKFIDSYVGSTVEEYVEEVTKPSINDFADAKISEFNRNVASKTDDFNTLAQSSEETLIQYVDSASLSAKNAKDSADVSTAQASISTAQAVISTTKASESLASANASANSAKQCQAIKDSLGTVYVFKGSVANVSSLPTNAKVGDVYDVQDSGNNYAWTGSSWDSLGVNVDLSNYVDISSEQTISGKKKFTQPLTIQNGEGTGSLWIGGNVNSSSLSNKNRHIARISVPSFNDITKATTMLGFDSSGDNTLSVANNKYDTLSFGGQKKITNATSPMAIGFCVTKTRESTGATDKVIPLEMDANEVRFNAQPNYKGNNLVTDIELQDAVANAGDVTYEDLDEDVTIIIGKKVLLKDKDGEVIIPYVDLPAGRNVGDIFYTSRTDTELNGAVECNGGTYSTSDFSGSQSIGDLLSGGKVPYVSLSEYASIVSSKGSCRAFGWDGGAEFRVPTLKDVYIECGTAESSGEFISESLPNIKGTLPTDSNGEGSLSGAFYLVGTSSGASGASSNNDKSGFDASRSSPVYKDGAKVKPDSVRYRAMVQLANKTTDEAVITATSALQQISNKANVDLSNVSSVSSSFKKQSISWGVPDYSAMIDISATLKTANSKYTAPKDGFISWLCNANGTTTTLYVNDIKTGFKQQCDSQWSYNRSSTTVLVAKGDVVYVDKSVSNMNAKFYPLKGAN